MAIPEPDWKRFKKVRARALERLCRRILDESAAICNDDSEDAHARYLRLYSLIRERDRDVAAAFDDFRRSTAVQCLRNMIALDLLDDEDIGEFSEDVQRWLSI